MKAVTLNAYGDVDNLLLKDIAEPKPGVGEIKVRMFGAGINPVDWKIRTGALKSMVPLVLPAVLGRDVSGEVVDVGQGVTKFAVGARVMGLVNGAYAEYVVGPVDAFCEVPRNVDLVDAAALPLALLTGAQLIEAYVQPHKGDIVLVTGAVGSVGRVAVYVAKSLGAEVWAGVRKAQLAVAATLGAAGIVALDDDAALAKMPLLNAIADTVGGPVVGKLLDKLRKGGTIGTVVGEPEDASARGFIVRGGMAHADARRLQSLALDVAAGKLVIPIVKRFPLASAGEAQKLAEHHAGGKVILMGPSQARALRGVSTASAMEAEGAQGR